MDHNNCSKALSVTKNAHYVAHGNIWCNPVSSYNTSTIQMERVTSYCCFNPWISSKLAVVTSWSSLPQRLHEQLYWCPVVYIMPDRESCHLESMDVHSSACAADILGRLLRDTGGLNRGFWPLPREEAAWKLTGANLFTAHFRGNGLWLWLSCIHVLHTHTHSAVIERATTDCSLHYQNIAL